MSKLARPSQWKQVGWLVLIFLAWKSFLLAIAAGSPGPGYDTSGLILSGQDHRRHIHFSSWPWPERMVIKLFRWDALYFIKAAQRGYVYEQEWAFSWAYSATLRHMVTSSPHNKDSPLLLHFLLAGIAVSNVAHLISAIVLYKLLNTIRSRAVPPNTPFIACVLHILSPASLFLVAPYSEAPFAALNFVGMLCYAKARVMTQPDEYWTLSRDAGILSSAIFFGLATWLRGNGLLSGIIFLCDVVVAIVKARAYQLEKQDLRRVGVTFVAGILMGLISVVPQYFAFREFCSTGRNSEARPWCHSIIPSIYTWVQREYWNVGFLRYWTLPNLPLFLMAAPMLWLLLKSGTTHIISTYERLGRFDTDSCDLPQLALPELMLAVAATTNFHVQIINRISSGYPIWYLSVATWISRRERSQGTDKREPVAPLIVRGMVLYCIVQGVLFAGFLPPA